MNHCRLTARWTAQRVASVFVCLLALGVAHPGFAEGFSIFDVARPGLAEGFAVSRESVIASLALETGADVAEPAAQPAGSAEGAEKAADEMSEQDQVAEALANPLSYLWLLFIQNDIQRYEGEALQRIGASSSQTQNTTLLQPVFSLQLTEKWKTILRPVIPVNSFKVVDNVNVSTDGPIAPTGVELGRETGLGDIVLWTAFSNNYTPPFVSGFGTTFMLNTAGDDQLGTGKNSVGPMVMGVKITEKWVYGVVAQHWWSFSGDDTLTVQTDVGPVQVPRTDVSLTDMQVILRYRKSLKTNIGAAPNWRYNWKADQLTLPLGIGFDTLVQFGKLPVKIGAEAYYFLESSDEFGPEWQFRFLFVPVIPAPDWSRIPLFGKK